MNVEESEVAGLLYDEPDGPPASARVGALLRAARHASGRSIDDIAAQSGLTRGFISKVERDRANPSIASLMRLCKALGLSLASLFGAARGDVVRAAERVSVDLGGDRVTDYLLTPFGETRVQAILSRLLPGGKSSDVPYSLPAGAEFAFVISGELEIHVDGGVTVLRAGDAFTFRADAAHTFFADPDGNGAEVLWVLSPAPPKYVRGRQDRPHAGVAADARPQVDTVAEVSRPT